MQRVNAGLKQEQSESPDEIPAHGMALPLISTYTDQVSLAVPMAVFNNRTHRICLRLIPVPRGMLNWVTGKRARNSAASLHRDVLRSVLHLDFLVRVLKSLSHVQLFAAPWSSPPGSSVHRIFQARILEWVDISSSTGSSPPRDWTHISCVSSIGRQVLYH